MQLDSIDFLHNDRLQALKAQNEQAQSDTEKRVFLMRLIQSIVDAINAKTIDTIEEGVTVNNLDEIHAALVNELRMANKPIIALLKDLNLSTEEQTRVTTEIQNKLLKKFADYQTVVVKRVKDIVEVSNLDDVFIPDSITIKNFAELIPKLEEIATKIGGLELSVNVEAPQVNVSPTPVNIPATVFPEQTPINLLPLLDVLEDINHSLGNIRTNNKNRPLAVRFTDGQDWIKQLVAATEKTSQAVAAFAGGNDQIRLVDINRQVINPVNLSVPSSVGDGTATVATAGTRVQLSATSVPCRYVIVVAKTTNTGVVYLGGATIATARGRPLNQEQSEKLDIDNLNKVYIDADNSNDGVSFVFVV